MQDSTELEAMTLESDSLFLLLALPLPSNVTLGKVLSFHGPLFLICQMEQ